MKPAPRRLRILCEDGRLVVVCDASDRTDVAADVYITSDERRDGRRWCAFHVRTVDEEHRGAVALDLAALREHGIVWRAVED